MRLLARLLLLSAAVHATSEPAPSSSSPSWCPRACRCRPPVVDCASANLTEAAPLDLRDASSVVVTTLDLSDNRLASVDLSRLLRLAPDVTRLSLRRNRLRSLAPKEQDDAKPLFRLTHLDLSHNQLHVLHAFALAPGLLPALRALNLSSNALHTVAPHAIALPDLQTLDLSHNNFEEVHAHFFEAAPRLAELDLSNNRLSRLNDGTFAVLSGLALLDLSHNAIMTLEDNVLAGMNVSHLDLGFNSLRRPPDAALRKMSAVRTLVLDGNLFSVLESGSLRDVRVEFLSVSHSHVLTRVERAAVAFVPALHTLTLNSNPRLAYVHPEAVMDAPNLVALDLSRNGLYALESRLRECLPSLKAISVAGNSLHCHCGLSWLADAAASSSSSAPSGSGLRVMDADAVQCSPSPASSGVLLRSLSGKLSEPCEPYIVPLFASSHEEGMGRDASWLCRALGSPEINITWRLSGRQGSIVGDDECLGRACVRADALTLRYLHPEDAGTYTCSAKNKFGQDQRSVSLHVKTEHIQIFPITVASTFVTLSWNTSGAALSSGRGGYILQVRDSDPSASTASAASDRPLLKQYEDIDVGLKMNSYTVNGLAPGRDYVFELCLRRESYVMPISSARLRTRASHFQTALGIETDYVSLCAVAVALVVLVCACAVVSSRRLWLFSRQKKRSAARFCGVRGVGAGGGADSMSQREMILSPSDHSSSAAMHYGIGGGAANSDEDAEDKSRLVDHEISSPVEDFFGLRETVA